MPYSILKRLTHFLTRNRHENWGTGVFVPPKAHKWDRMIHAALLSALLVPLLVSFIPLARPLPYYLTKLTLQNMFCTFTPSPYNMNTFAYIVTSVVFSVLCGKFRIILSFSASSFSHSVTQKSQPIKL